MVKPWTIPAAARWHRHREACPLYRGQVAAAFRWAALTPAPGSGSCRHDIPFLAQAPQRLGLPRWQDPGAAAAALTLTRCPPSSVGPEG